MHARDNLLSIPGALGRAAAVGALMLAPGLTSCSEGERSLDWQAIEYPLFEQLEEQCATRSMATIDERRAGKVEVTEAPAEIQWAPDMEAAIERATLEDKPIFIASSVRKGGLNKSGCDV